MATPTGPLSLVLPKSTYRDYFYRSKTYTFCGSYTAVLVPHAINPTAAAATTATDNVAQAIYAMAQEGVTTAFLQWHQGERGRGAQIALLHLVSSYVPMMGLLASPWDDLSFASKGDITCSTIACVNWQTASLHQIGTTIHILTDLDIDTALAANPAVDLLRPFTATDKNVEPLHICKTIKPPTPFVGIFLDRDLTPAEAWTRIHGTIVDGG